MEKELLFPAKEMVTAPVVGCREAFPIRRIFCVGRNYMAHAKEMGASVDKSSQNPFYFLKDSSCYVPSGAHIVYPPMTQNYHHEVELVVAIGKEGFQVPEAQANDLIFGYACGLDMTRRDIQFQARSEGKPWDLSKNFEESAVLTDITPAAQAGNIAQAKIALSVNNEVRQSACLADLIWTVPEIIADLSKYYHLQPGDLIYTGTPEGVGAVVSGDHLHGFVEGIAEIELYID